MRRIWLVMVALVVVALALLGAGAAVRTGPRSARARRS